MGFPPRFVAPRILVCLATVLAIAALTFVSSAKQSGAARVTQPTATRWYRGNTHTHTNNSDGDSSPAAVAAAYKDLGYNFVVITDHNKLTDVDSINSELAEPGTFLAIKGEEVTDSFNGKPVHLNSINNITAIAPQHGSNVVSTIDNNFAAIRSAGGLPYVAHPNFYFAISANDLLSSSQALLFEVYNAHPVVNNAGDASHPSTEQMWDSVLTDGKLLYGVAADDEHTLLNGAGALPGRAWVMVRAASLDAPAITQALASGDFYSSTGVTLDNYVVTASDISIAIAGSNSNSIDFIGRNGQVLQHTNANNASYQFTGHEQYVRVQVINQLGQKAWTQPVFTERLNQVNPIVNGASFGTEPTLQKVVAAGSVASALGVGLASVTMQAGRDDDGLYPTTLAGTSVTIDGQLASVFYVSSTQVNFQIPPDTPSGVAQVVVTNQDGLQMRTSVIVTDTAPGIFTEDGSGHGRAVVFDLDKLLGKRIVADDGLRRFYLYATGVRSATNLSVTLNGQPVNVERIRACRGLPGLDQITIVFPDNLGHAGDNSLLVTADGFDSNTAILAL